MKKINHFTMDDILQRRTFTSINKKTDKNDKNSKRKSIQEDEVQINENQLIMNILQEFNINKKNQSPTFSNDTKTHLVNIISKKLNLKLNATKIIPKMKIKRIQHIEIIEKPHLNQKYMKKSSQNTMQQSRKLDSSIRHSSKAHLNQKKFSYFILSGSIHDYEKDQSIIRKKSFFEDQISDETAFYNWKQFEAQYPGFKRVKTYSQFMGFGSAFSLKPQSEQQKQDKEHSYTKQTNILNQNQIATKSIRLSIGQESIFVEIQNPEQGDDYINHTGMEFDKMAGIIENFPIFKALGRKIRNYIQFFQFKEYQRNQEVYSIGDPVDKFYLLLKGQIVFEHSKINPIQTALTSPQGSRKNSLHMQFTIKTETVSSGNYFGQEEMIFQKQQRLLTAKCKSSKCQVLEINKEKFDKMLEYSDFHDCVKKAAEVKFLQRLSKLQKNQQIRAKFALTESNEDNSQQIPLSTQRPTDRKAIPLLGTPKVSLDGKYRVMHGNAIRQFSKDQKQKMSETVQFSMLKVNPDMYDKTVDKFRKYNIKPKEKYKPEINWELKRVWKVLNLENVLREEAEVSSPQGRKFYDSHKRYVYHLKESKSLRPKTTSSTYRTKLQYIAYLQQFKPEK